MDTIKVIGIALWSMVGIGAISGSVWVYLNKSKHATLKDKTVQEQGKVSSQPASQISRDAACHLSV
jgi:hypothetical protein